MQIAGATYHVTSRGNRRGLIFTDDADRALFLSLLAEVVRRTGWLCLAYCLMPTHVHLVFETPEPNLPFGMQRLIGTYARFFNDRHGFWGHVFGGRFGSEVVESERHALEVARYVVLNPFRAGLAASPNVGRWSSYAATAGFRLAEPFLRVDRVLRDFGEGDAARARYVAFVADGRP
jgi:REP element-mobilizing transposase RayT